MKATVLGAGSWGTALAILLARNDWEVVLWGRDEDELGSMRALKENVQYLAGFALSDEISPTSNSNDLQDSDIWVIAVPSHGVRGVSSLITGSSPKVVMASKGLEASTGMLLLDVVAEICPQARPCVLSGPNLALEIVRGIPTAAIAASTDDDLAEVVRGAFMGRTFRVYRSHDVVGVELAGALKNVLAVGAGMSDGLGFGDNTKGAFLARGLKEMVTLGLAMGGCLETFIGIAGVGDLFATASSNLSRNYRAGVSLGKGSTLQAAVSEIGQVVEGVATSECVQMLARKHQVEMPVFNAIEAVIRGQMSPLRAVETLMERTTPTEGLPIDSKTISLNQ